MKKDDNKMICVINFKQFIDDFKKYIYVDRISDDMNYNLIKYIEVNSEIYSKEEYIDYLKKYDIYLEK